MSEFTFQHQVIAAQPGWFACSPIWGEAGIEGLYEEPVVAWVISYDLDGCGETSLRTADPVAICSDASDCWLVKKPDGAYMSRASQVFECQADAISELQNVEGIRSQNRQSAS